MSLREGEAWSKVNKRLLEKKKEMTKPMERRQYAVKIRRKR